MRHFGRFPFNQKFRDFRSEIEWNGKSSGKSFRKFRNTFWVHPLWWNFQNYRKFCVPFATDVGFSLPTERELTWTREKTIMAVGRRLYDRVLYLPHSTGTAVFAFLAKLRAAQMNCQLEFVRFALFLASTTRTFPWSSRNGSRTPPTNRQGLLLRSTIYTI